MVVGEALDGLGEVLGFVGGAVEVEGAVEAEGADDGEDVAGSGGVLEVDAGDFGPGDEAGFSGAGAEGVAVGGDAELEAAWHEADVWIAATEGRAGEDATLASISAERRRALSWLRDRDAEPA